MDSMSVCGAIEHVFVSPRPSHINYKILLYGNFYFKFDICDVIAACSEKKTGPDHES